MMRNMRYTLLVTDPTDGLCMLSDDFDRLQKVLTLDMAGSAEVHEQMRVFYKVTKKYYEESAKDASDENQAAVMDAFGESQVCRVLSPTGLTICR